MNISDLSELRNEIRIVKLFRIVFSLIILKLKFLNYRLPIRNLISQNTCQKYNFKFILFPEWKKSQIEFFINDFTCLCI